MLDKIAITFIARYTPGGGVGMGNIAISLQFCHLVPYSGRTNRQAVFVHYYFGTYRDVRVNQLFYDYSQNLSAPLRHGIHGGITFSLYKA
jgi:hypothetical protein